MLVRLVIVNCHVMTWHMVLWCFIDINDIQLLQQHGTTCYTKSFSCCLVIAMIKWVDDELHGPHQIICGMWVWFIHINNVPVTILRWNSHVMQTTNIETSRIMCKGSFVFSPIKCLTQDWTYDISYNTTPDNKLRFTNSQGKHVLIK